MSLLAIKGTLACGFAAVSLIAGYDVFKWKNTKAAEESAEHDQEPSIMSSAEPHARAPAHAHSIHVVTDSETFGDYNTCSVVEDTYEYPPQPKPQPGETPRQKQDKQDAWEVECEARDVLVAEHFARWTQYVQAGNVTALRNNEQLHWGETERALTNIRTEMRDRNGRVFSNIDSVRKAVIILSFIHENLCSTGFDQTNIDHVRVYSRGYNQVVVEYDCEHQRLGEGATPQDACLIGGRIFCAEEYKRTGLDNIHVRMSNPAKLLHQINYLCGDPEALPCPNMNFLAEIVLKVKETFPYKSLKDVDNDRSINHAIGLAISKLNKSYRTKQLGIAMPLIREMVKIPSYMDIISTDVPNMKSSVEQVVEVQRGENRTAYLDHASATTTSNLGCFTMLQQIVAPALAITKSCNPYWKDLHTPAPYDPRRNTHMRPVGSA